MSEQKESTKIIDKYSSKRIEILRQLFLSNSGDVTILLSNNTSLKLHSYVINKCVFFEKLLDTPLEESKTKTIDLQSYDPHIVVMFFEYMYTYTLYNFKINMLMDLLKLADNFMFDELCISISYFLENKITFLKKKNDIEDLKESEQEILAQLCIMLVKNKTKPYLEKAYYYCINIFNDLLESDINYVDLELIQKSDICFDTIKPNTKYSCGVKSAKYNTHYCCLHYYKNKIKHNHLLKPNTSTKINFINVDNEKKNRYSCISFAIEQKIDLDNDDIYLDMSVATHFCCFHKNKQSVPQKYDNMIAFSKTKKFSFFFKMNNEDKAVIINDLVATKMSLFI